MSFTQQDQIFQLKTVIEFENLCLKIFQYQAEMVPVYAKYIKLLSIIPAQVKSIRQIPFLPVNFFKSHHVKGNDDYKLIFTSSATTGSAVSQHFVQDLSIYKNSFNHCFKQFYGNPAPLTILALLPSYLERGGSSLVYMVEELIKQSALDSGFYLYNHEELYEKLIKIQKQKKPVLLIGVSFALCDFAEKYQLNFPELMVMETGGMKGKRKEIIREELHQILQNGFGVPSIHSEYGMTELLSQAYSTGNGIFVCPPWMRVLIRDTNDPLSFVQDGKTGGINIIDLANINSCSFIATQDLGKTHYQNSFEVLGRFDNSDIRGCNLLIE